MGGSWQRLHHGSITAGGNTGAFTPKENMRVILNIKNSGNIQPELTCGTGGSIDTGNNYSTRGNSADIDSSDFTRTSQDSIETERATNGNMYLVFDVTNISNKEKLFIGHVVSGETAGAGNAPVRWELVGKWANTSGQINIFGLKNTQGGSIASGSTITVLGATGDTITDEKTTITNVPTNTQYRETDTRKIYRRAAAVTPVFEETFADNSRSWNLSSSEVTISGGTLNFVNNSSNDDNIAYLDISSFLTGSALPSSWTMRFKVILNDFKNNASGQAVAFHAGVSNNTSLTGENPSSTNASNIKIGSHAASDNGNFQLVQWRSGTSRQDTTSSNNFSNPYTATIYCELKADGTTLSMIGYDNSDYTSANTYANTNNITLSGTYNDYKYVFFKFFYQGVTESVTTKVDDVKIYETADSVDVSWKERGTA